MIGNSRLNFILTFIFTLVVACLSTSCSEDRDPEFKLTPNQSPVTIQTTIPSSAESIEVGTGLGKGEPAEAIKKALGMALQGKTQKNPDFMIIYPTAGSDCEKILQEARRIVGNATKIYGGTSDARGVLSDGGYVTGSTEGYASAEGNKDKHNAVAVMTVSTQDIQFGVGSASIANYNSPREMAETALHDAIKNAGKGRSEKPSIILITPTIGLEQQVLEGVTQVVGSDVILLGGTAGGPGGNVIGNGQVYSKGVSVAVFYTDLPIGWVFEAGFEKEDRYSGIVTEMEGQRIVKIDNQPAYEVYDRWLGGEVTRRFQEEGGKSAKFRDFLSLHPLFRKRQSPDGDTYSIFSHPWAPNKELITSGLNTTTDIKVGERVYLSYGTWEVLLNRIGNLPLNAKKTMDLNEKAPVYLAIGTICAGVMGVIPEDERQKFPVLINYSNSKAPFIANITWGEQGALPGVGLQHCNLTTSFLVIGSNK